MDKKTKAGPKIAEIAGKIVALLEPLSSDDRQKVINGSLTLLGEASSGGAPPSGASGSAGRAAGGGGKPPEKLGGPFGRGKKWVKQKGRNQDPNEKVVDITSDRRTHNC